MNTTGSSPLPGPDAEALFLALNEELAHLEEALAHFHELPPEQRLPRPEDYREQISIRRELLSLLGRVNM